MLQVRHIIVHTDQDAFGLQIDGEFFPFAMRASDFARRFDGTVGRTARSDGMVEWMYLDEGFWLIVDEGGDRIHAAVFRWRGGNCSHPTAVTDKGFTGASVPQDLLLLHGDPSISRAVTYHALGKTEIDVEYLLYDDEYEDVYFRVWFENGVPIGLQLTRQGILRH